MSKNRPTPVTVTIPAIIVLSITAWNMIRVFSSISNWQILDEFGARPAYILGTGIVWALIGSGLLYSIRTRQRHSRRAGFASAGLYYLWYWVDKLFVQASPAPNTIFVLYVSTFVLVIFCVMLGTSATKNYFKTEW